MAPTSVWQTKQIEKKRKFVFLNNFLLIFCFEWGLQANEVLQTLVKKNYQTWRIKEINVTNRISRHIALREQKRINSKDQKKAQGMHLKMHTMFTHLVVWNETPAPAKRKKKLNRQKTHDKSKTRAAAAAAKKERERAIDKPERIVERTQT